MTPGQCRAARALLNWSQADLGKRATLAKWSVVTFENGKSDKMHPNHVKWLQRAIESAGVRFVEFDTETGVVWPTKRTEPDEEALSCEPIMADG
jgi:bifunctional ADP-heptose synthase (sugar kinase/adenylyltransferase)